MKFVWREKLGNSYLVRWIADFGWFSIRLHHWLGPDDLRAVHDHAWDFISVVLYGRIIECHEDQTSTQRGWMTARRFKAEYQHSVIPLGNTWTLLICGPERREWGFWVNDKFRKRNKYFFEHGHH